MTAPKSEDGAHVVVVDDDPAIVELLETALRAEGLQTTGFVDPAEALQAIAEGLRPDLLIVDYVMPEMNGDEFLRALPEPVRSAPFVLVTALSDPNMCIDLARSRDLHVIGKPFDLEHLILEARALLARSSAAPASQPRADGGRPSTPPPASVPPPAPSAKRSSSRPSASF